MKSTMTRKHAKAIIKDFENLGFKTVYGYCTHQKSKDCVALGVNYGYLGWNWTLWISIEDNTLYVDAYRW